MAHGSMQQWLIVEGSLLRTDLSLEMKALEVYLTRRFVAGTAYFATGMTVLDVFTD